MMRAASTFGFQLLFVTLVVAQQRVVPGVNPQHYEQHYQQPQAPQFQQPPQHVPQQQQQYAPQQQQHQQPPQQQQFQQQQPPQQQQQQFQQQQPPQQQQQNQPHPNHQQQQQHDHHHGGHHQQHVLGGNVQSEKQHIQEHMEVPMDTSKMSEQELQFHYFKMHDADNNNKLDGCELIKSLIHWHDQGNKESNIPEHSPQQPPIEDKIFTDDELVSLIDPILTMDDYSRDGFIDYPEFVRAQQKAAQANARDRDRQNEVQP